jgi:putative ABC transport system permease protein
VRSVRKNSAFATIVILTLALGIGANAAIFSVVNAMLLRSLPFADPDRLVRIYHTYPFIPGGIEGLSPADFFALRDQTRAFQSVGTYRTSPDGFAFLNGVQPELAYGTYVGPDFFKALGVPPLLGQTFEAEDEKPSSPFKVVVSYGFWQRRLHSDPNVIGRALNFAGLSAPVVGVMPSGFWFPRSDRSEFWAIERMAPPQRQGPWFFQAVGRLRPGVTIAQAQDDLGVAARVVQQKFPQPTSDWALVTRPFREQLVGDLRPALLLLFGAVGFVLVIACVNVMNLMLARATGREREISVRVALGASRGRIIRQLLTEALLLTLVGAALGLLIAHWGVAALLALTPAKLQVLHDANITTDWRVVALAIATAMALAIVFALAPVIDVTSRKASRVIGASTRTTETGARRRLRGALVVAEITLSVMLLIGAGLLTRSLVALQSVNAGVNAERVLAAMITVPPARVRDRAAIDEFFSRLLTALRAQPGVEAVSASDSLPPAGPVGATNFIVDGHPMLDGQAEPISEFVNIEGNYFKTLGIPMLRGRTFDERDTPKSPNTVIINDAFARRFFPEDDPIGHKLRVGGDWVATIVGIVASVKYGGLDGNDELTMYGAASAAPRRTMAIIVRTAGEPLNFVPALRTIVAYIDPQTPLGRTRSFDQLMSESVVAPRFRTALLVLFAIVALVLAAIGIYGLLTYSVTQRTQEMGIRMALGAQGVDVSRLVIGDGLRLAGAGVALGLASGIALTRVMRGVLYDISPTDPVTFISVALLLIVVSTIACWIPARRATRVDPMIALRWE